MRLFHGTALAILAACVSQAQSLDPKNPAPLKPGVNASNIDAFMTPHYWTFLVEKGQAKINLTFRSQSILGAFIRTQVAFSIYDVRTPDKKGTLVLESTGQEVSRVFEGPSEVEHQMVIEVTPPKAMVRAGGDYQIQAVAGIKFSGSGESSSSEPLLTQHFRNFTCNSDAQCGIKFLPQGEVVTASGERGSWRLFDAARSVYVIVIGNQRQSVKWKPGIGLVSVHDDGMVVYQEVR